MTDAMLKNWLTTLGGILAGIPALVAGSGFTLSPNWQKASYLCGGLGLLILGVSAKQFNNHSTIAQVEQATVGQMPQSQQTNTVQAIQPLPTGGVAVTSASTTVTKPPEVPKP